MGRALHRAVHRVVHRAVPRSITLNLGVGCAPSCWPIFGFRNLLGARRGAEGSFLCSLITDFLAEGAGWGASPGRGGELGCHRGGRPTVQKASKDRDGDSGAFYFFFRARACLAGVIAGCDKVG